MIDEPSALAPLVTRMLVQALDGEAGAATMAREARARSSDVSLDVIPGVPP
jgi:hypothetical protein